MTIGNFGYGQADYSDTVTEFGAISFIVRQMMSQMVTMKLVKVHAVHLGSGDPPGPATVDVLPLVNQIDGNNNSSPHGTVYGLPCYRTQGGPCAIIIDPAVGDVGYVVASDRDISSVKAGNGKQSNPGSFRRFDIADGVYVGGVLNAAPTNYLRINNDVATLAIGTGASARMTATEITLTVGGINIQITGTAITFNGPVVFNGTATGVGGTVDFGSSVLKTSGEANLGSVVSSGDVTAGAVSLETHEHTGVTTGAGISGPPV